MRKRNPAFTYGVLGVVVIFFVIVICVAEANSSLSFTHFLSDTKSFENEQTLSFADVDAVKMNVNDVPVSVIESNVDEVTITSTVQNNGIGLTTQPKAWIDNNTLYYEQGIILGIEPKSSGSVIVEIPAEAKLEYNISNGSGDVLLEVSTAKDVTFDMAIGELSVYASCELFTANTVSGDINIYGAVKNTIIDTVSSDVSLFANATTNEIDFESVSGDCKVFADELGGYHLYHKYAGGNIDDYFELSSNNDNTITISADTVDGSVEVYDKAILDGISDFFKEDK